MGFKEINGQMNISSLQFCLLKSISFDVPIMYVCEFKANDHLVRCVSFSSIANHTNQVHTNGSSKCIAYRFGQIFD